MDSISFDSFDSNICKVFFRLPDLTAATLITMKGHNIYQHTELIPHAASHILRFILTDFLYCMSEN